MNFIGLQTGLKNLYSGLTGGAGGAGAWTPTSLTGVQSFRDVGGGALVYTTTGGSTRSTDGTAAARIVDSVNTTYNALASTSPATYKIGANGKPYLEFNGMGNRYDDMPIGLGFTAHHLNIKAAGYHNVFDDPDHPAPGRMLWIDTSRRPEMDAALIVGTPLTLNTWYTVFTWRGSGSSELWINGVSVATSATVRIAATRFTEFHRGGASTFNGCVSSWLFGSSKPSAAEIALLHAYMAANTPT